MPTIDGEREGATPDDASAAGAAEGVPAAQVEFVSEGFAELFPTFLLHRIPPGPKAALWERYRGKWVRWTGKLVSFTANGVTFKHLNGTSTFDVSLWLEGSERDDLRQRYQPGDHVTYVGRLDSFDDIFRTMYLTNGRLVGGVSSVQDLGFVDAFR